MSVSTLYFTSILMGICIGLAETPSGIYVCEITTPKLRGTMVMLDNSAVGTGAMLIYFITSLLSWRTACLICMAWCILSILLLTFVSANWSAPKSFIINYFLLNASGRTNVIINEIRTRENRGQRLKKVIFFTSCYQIPDSPVWLIRKGRTEAAVKALRWLRGWVPEANVIAEYQELSHFIEKSQRKSR